MIKIHVEKMEEEIERMVSFLASENYYVLQDFHFVNLTNDDDCLKKDGMYGVFRDIGINFSLYAKSGKKHDLSIALNQIKLDYNFEKEKLYGFYNIVHMPTNNSSEESKDIFNELFVESRISRYFNRNDIEELTINPISSEKFIKINIEDIENEMIRLIDITLCDSVFNVDRETIKIEHSIYSSKNLHKSIFVDCCIRETGRRADFILDLRHMQYDYESETMYGFFSIGISNVFAILRNAESDAIYCSISEMVQEKQINLSFNKNVNAFM